MGSNDIGTSFQYHFEKGVIYNHIVIILLSFLKEEETNWVDVWVLSTVCLSVCNSIRALALRLAIADVHHHTYLKLQRGTI